MFTPFGTLWMAQSDSGLCGADLGEDELAFVVDAERRMGTPLCYDPSHLVEAVHQLREYFENRREIFTLSIDLTRVSSFQRTVLQAVTQVPYGSVASYRDVARAIGRPRAARAVGTAVATSPISIVVPCHRIVRSDGTPGEYAMRSLGRQGRALKMKMLAGEGYREW